MNKMCVTSSPAFRDRAKRLSQKLSIPFIENVAEEAELIVEVLENSIEIRYLDGDSKSFSLDFDNPRLIQRSQQSELLSKAIRVKSKSHLEIVDATAGLGRDAFIMANQGHKVTMIEQSLVMSTILEDSLRRFKDNHPTHQVSSLLTLVQANSALWLDTMEMQQRPDVIYIDPMFEKTRKKQALPKKDIRLLQLLSLQTSKEDVLTLLEIAMATATKKVVVKQGKSSAFDFPYKPDAIYTGKAISFEVFFRHG